MTYAISTTLQGSVIVGSQTIQQASGFTFELFDCADYVTATSFEDINVQVFTELENRTVIVSTTDANLCPISDLSLSGTIIGVSMTESGVIYFDTNVRTNDIL